jgi:anti-sigma B factor antagonist
MSGTPRSARSIQDVVVSSPAKGTAVVELRGEHDRVTAAEMRDLLQQLLLANSLLIVDVTDAQFVDSSFVHNLIRADQQARESKRLLVLQMGTDPGVKRVLEVTGLVQHLKCADSREEALTAATPSRSP